MSFTKKILETVNSLGLADDTPLTGVVDEELARELAQRNEFREAAPPRGAQNPLAKLAGPGEDKRQKRAELQAKRRKAFTEEAERQSQDRKKAQDEEFRRIVEEARRQQAGGASSRPPPRSAGSNARSKSRRAPGGFGQKPDIAKHYKVLNLPYGAPFDEVKTAYRKLMRKYHPDLHNQTPKKQKAATELTMQVTQAFNALEDYLEGGPNKG